MRRILGLCALLAGGGVGYVALFLVAEGWPALPRLAGPAWDPERGLFGVAPMVAGTAAVTLGALALAVPAGVAAAVFLSEVAPRPVAAAFRLLLKAFAGVPSVIWGFWGLAVLVPAVRTHLGGPGFSVLAGAVVLALMVLPTIAVVAADGLQALPRSLREGGLALGATRGQMVRRILLPAARPAIAAGVVLALGRAAGETIALLMVTGNVPAAPRSLLEPARTLTGSVALEMAYAAGEHRQALFAVGLLLLGLVLAAGAAARMAAAR